MALQLVYNDEQGITNNEAYARIGRIDVNRITDSCEFRVIIYHTVSTRSKSDPLARKGPVGGYKYLLTGNTYTTYLADTVLAEENKTITSQLYTWLKQHVDKAEADIGENDDRVNHGHSIDWTAATDV